ncbi:cytochrome P450 4d2-like [Onthophagus taurus]|uniref:cytochrome P450 4d2-like n=1 Tax=Onthophagus taurus TaxID=166361 RepID=UPI000C20AF59|nr:cytochrome P450 4d2-like [Onthophagus taurus]
MLILLVEILFLIFLFYCVFIKPYKELDKLPGPSTLELIKNYSYYSSRKGIVSYLRTLNDKYGRIVKVWIKPFKPMIVTSDIDYVDKIYKSNDLHITPIFFEMIFLREGIMSNSNYDSWKKDKQTIQKAVTREYISGKISVYDKKYDEFLDIIRKNLGKPFDVESPLYHIVLDIMMHTMQDSNIDLTAKEVQDYTKFRVDFFNLLFEKMNSFAMMGPLHKFTKNYKLMIESKNNIVNFSRNLVERLKSVKTELRDKHNLIYAMINSGMPEERIIDNINTMIHGGHETSIIPLALGFYQLSQRPELQQKILDEIHTIIGKDVKTPITLKDLNLMIYLRAFIKECVRCYFTGPFLDRKTEEEIEIHGVKIPKGTHVMFDLVNIATSDQSFDDPHVFNPDRFLKENMTSRTARGDITFGYGIRTCPGKHIAYAAMKILIVKVIREFEICPLQQEHKIELVSEIFFRSVHGIPIRFQKRNL